MTLALQVLLGGLTAGSIYALVALGVALIFKVSRVLNLAQGEFVTIGALVAYSAINGLHLPLAAAVGISIVVLACVGMAFERLAIRPARSQSMTTLLVITLGASVLMRGVAQVVWGKEPMSLPSFSGDQPLNLLGASLLPQSVWIVGGLLLSGIGLWVYLERSLAGKAMLAAAENQAAAEMIGIDALAMRRIGFALSAALGALAGVLVAPNTYITYDGGTIIGLKGFVAATLLGMGSLPGAIVGGLLLGLLEAGAATVSSQFRDASAFVVLIVALLVRSGLDKRQSLADAADR